MPNFLESPAFRIYAVCSTTLVLKMFVITILTGRTRARLQAFVNPEDAQLTGATARGEEPPEIQRLHRVHRNDLENILPFFAIGLIYVLSGASTLGATAYFVTFTIARVLHTVCYLASLQPWRTITFGIGVLCMLGMMVQILIAAL